MFVKSTDSNYCLNKFVTTDSGWKHNSKGYYCSNFSNTYYDQRHYYYWSYYYAIDFSGNCQSS